MLTDTCCFTGHRIIPDNYTEHLKNNLRKIIVTQISLGITSFVCGGAVGFDTICAELILELKKDFPGIKLILALPCPQQNINFSEKQNIEYLRIKESCDEYIYTSDAYTKGCMYKRNRFMVDMSGTVVAYCTKSSGGTFYTLKYATEKNRKIISIQ